ncbi:protein of unknown function DUF820 (plasmid) [Thalassoporum mexicanum PCC 7367]|uniref:Uma2 family endonuclease n=1 Tax=Thalassoporum mexicanum TaxID=3457544 RepID=UPI00029F870F|nr:Uma2 family endonuclease [Pseudanabaena sp. PCC 7367]AFY72122.1 protein of unknown function DUF820 [Pseudanabaena sp. PCC 7367]
MYTYILNLESVLDLDDDAFYRLCANNPEVLFERSAQGELVINPLSGGTKGMQNAQLIGSLGIWNRQAKLGHGFDGSAGFTLPNGAIRSPDLSWIRNDRWDALSKEERESFAPLCPDFVMELVSWSDNLKLVQAKMIEYIENGAQLGWLINPEAKQVEIYRPGQSLGQEKELLEMPQSLSGEDVLPGFELDLGFLWE